MEWIIAKYRAFATVFLVHYSKSYETHLMFGNLTYVCPLMNKM
jgi:hypothetical protein